MTQLLQKRFSELEAQILEIESTKQVKHDRYNGISYDHIEQNLLLNWKVKAKNLLIRACGESSQHFLSFVEAEKQTSFGNNYELLLRIKAVFLAAKEDFEGGYLNSLKNLVQADIFDNELDQASELLTNGYLSAAAVVAGVVLETTIRNMCIEQKISLGKLDKMNADLAKAGSYNSLIQKKITALAAIRNSAAHGKADEYSKEDVKSMIEEVRRFTELVLS